MPTASCSPVSPFLRFLATEPSRMKAIRTEGCHVGHFREFIGTACITDSRIRPMSKLNQHGGGWYCIATVILMRHYYYVTWALRRRRSPTTRRQHCTLRCPCSTYVLWPGPPPHSVKSWWRHQMDTFSALLVFCAGNSPVTGEFLTQRPLMRSFDVFFRVCLNKRLSKQSWDTIPLIMT